MKIIFDKIIAIAWQNEQAAACIEPIFSGGDHVKKAFFAQTTT